jgi:beta-lactamase class A
MLDRGELVNEQYSGEMKRMLSNPGISHKFVKGLSVRRGRTIYRKSGTWRDWHCDAALVEAGNKRYIAAALVKSPKGGDILVGLIRELDSLIVRPSAPLTSEIASASRSLSPATDARQLN